MRQYLKGHYSVLAVLTVAWIIMIVVVNPLGNFPLDDDWMYARSVLYLLTQHRYIVTEPYSPVLIPQAVWGALFCVFSGFSFTALRISTLFIGLIGIFFTYFIAYDITSNKKLSFVGALLLLINPLYFSLANSFMTGVPFLALVLISIYFFARAIQNHQLKDILIATVFSILATLVRQLGIVIPIAYAIVMVFESKQTIKMRIKHFLPFLVTAFMLVLAVLFLVYRVHSGIKFFQGHSAMPMLQSSFSKSYRRLGYVLIYSGLFLFPFLLFTTIGSFRNLTRIQKIITIVVILAVIPSFKYVYDHFPRANILNDGFIGPNLLRDAYVFHTKPLYTFPQAILMSICWVGIIGAIMLIINLARTFVTVLNHYKKSVIDSTAVAPRLLFVGLCLGGYCILTFLPFFYFDRYILPCTALLWIIICAGKVDSYKSQIFSSVAAYSNRVTVFILAGAFVLVFMLFSAVGTHDWLAWNRARLTGVDYLMNDMKIPADKFDAGYEENGWLLGGEHSTHGDKTWWFVEDNEYMLAFRTVKGYQCIKQFYYQNYFPYEQRSILLLKKE